MIIRHRELFIYMVLWSLDLDLMHAAAGELRIWVWLSSCNVSDLYF